MNRFFEIANFLHQRIQSKIRKVEKYFIGVVTDKNYSAIEEFFLEINARNAIDFFEITRGDWLNIFVVSLENDRFCIVGEIIKNTYDKKIVLINESNKPHNLFDSFKLNVNGFVAYENGYLFSIDKGRLIGTMYQAKGKKYIG